MDGDNKIRNLILILSARNTASLPPNECPTIMQGEYLFVLRNKRIESTKSCNEKTMLSSLFLPNPGKSIINELLNVILFAIDRK